MIRKNPSGDLPVIDQSAYVDQTAIICGKVIIHENVFIGPYAVIRADEVNAQGEMQPIVIGANSNIQDGVVIHSKAGAAVSIGFNSVLFNCKIGSRSAVRHNAVVDGRDLPEDFYVPAMSHIHATTDLSQFPPIDISISEFSESVISTNIEFVQGYQALHNEF